jgi:hypothetical protein
VTSVLAATLTLGEVQKLVVLSKPQLATVDVKVSGKVVGAVRSV